MRKNSIAIISLAFLASCFMVSCSTEAFDTNQPVKGAKIVIPAQKMSTKAVDADGKATFLTSENVYIAKSGTIDENAIHPSAESASTTFAGTLKGSYSQGDKITVLYNTNASGVVDYSGQDGSIGSVKDAGYAEDVEIVSYSEGVLTTEFARIQNLQSIFKFSFYNGSISEDKKISGIRFVRVFSTNNKLVSSFNAKSKSNSFGPVTISRSTDLDDNYIYAALRFDSNDGDEIVFQVVDNAGNVYSGSKAAPSGGFGNGNIYNSSVVVTRSTFSTSASTKVCFSPGDLGVDNGVYSFTEPFTAWNQTSSEMTTKSTPAAKRTWFIRSEVQSGQTVCGIDWRIQEIAEWKYLVGLTTGRTIDNGNVSLYYKVHINTQELGDRYWCYLLPPDEATYDDIEDDLRNKKGGTDYYEVTNYLKYIAKGFVLLMDTDYSQRYSTTGNWSYQSGKHAGYYHAAYNSSSKTYFSFESTGPAQNSPGMGTDQRIHARYIHNITP